MKNLPECQAFKHMQYLHAHAHPQPLTKKAIEAQWIDNGRLHFSYAGYGLSEEILNMGQRLADEQHVHDHFKELISGKLMNITENRAVLHHQTRSNQPGFYQDQWKKISEFATQVRPTITTIVQVGIGGSELGPRAVYQALSTLEGSQNKPYIPIRWLTSVDKDECRDTLKDLDLDKTLFLAVSKSGTTVETLENRAQINQYLSQRGIQNPKDYWVSVTMPGTPLDDPDQNRAVFYLDAPIGGRFSTTSAVGIVPLSLAFGPDVVSAFLLGAHQMDLTAQNPNIRHNMAAMAALLTIWDRNICGHTSRALIPYSYALSRWVQYVQQVSCESNGKQVNRQGVPLRYPTGMPIWGDVGTNAQHSFFQLLHQGSSTIPVQFIGCGHSEGVKPHLIAQMVALSVGAKDNAHPHRVCPGHRPNSLIWMPTLSPESLGALLAFYENTTVFESFFWNINAFDQEGVQLGKSVTHAVVQQEGKDWPLLLAYLRLTS